MYKHVADSGSSVEKMDVSLLHQQESMVPAARLCGKIFVRRGAYHTKVQALA